MGWVSKHQGRQSNFSFQILEFFNSALERQVGEAVRILKTGAERILNSRGEFNRCSLPIITTKEEIEVETLGDREEDEPEGPEEDSDEAEGAPEVRMTKKETRLRKMCD